MPVDSGSAPITRVLPPERRREGVRYPHCAGICVPSFLSSRASPARSQYHMLLRPVKYSTAERDSPRPGRDVAGLPPICPHPPQEWGREASPHSASPRPRRQGLRKRPLPPRPSSGRGRRKSSSQHHRHALFCNLRQSGHPRSPFRLPELSRSLEASRRSGRNRAPSPGAGRR